MKEFFKSDAFVFPGDTLFKLETGDNVRIGQGVLKKGENLIAVRSGYLHKDGNKVWVETAQRRVCWFVYALLFFVDGLFL